MNAGASPLEGRKAWRGGDVVQRCGLREEANTVNDTGGAFQAECMASANPWNSDMPGRSGEL